MRLFWIASHVTLAALALRYWDIYLLKKQLDAPFSVMTLLAAIFAIVYLPCGSSASTSCARPDSGGHSIAIVAGPSRDPGQASGQPQ